YKGSVIDSIERKDGAILRNLTLDENNNLLDTEITYPDGTIQIIADGKVSRAIKPDGMILNYNEDGSISSILYPNSQIANCSYAKDGQGNIIETIVTDSEKTSHYDSNNRLTKVKFNTGKIIEYNSGIISKITENDLSQYIFEIKTNLDSTISSDLSRYIAPDGTVYRYVIDSNSSLISI
ncbi:MAG: hypothetical protein NTY47_06175, partial [Candidatus Omnitrophica bacterium]|nr:hypothetical protein [Candidatus Omnitrophota bacterium]